MSKIFHLNSDKFSERAERKFRNTILRATMGGDPEISEVCRLLASTLGFPKAHCVIEIESCYYAVGRFGYVGREFDFSEAEQPKLQNTTEFLSCPTEIKDFHLWPEELRSLNYLLVSPIFLEGVRVGYCGVADVVPRTRANRQTIRNIEGFANLCAYRLSAMRTTHICAEMLLANSERL